MLPTLAESGLLPPGIHLATWEELDTAFGLTPHREKLLGGLRRALELLAAAGCRVAYIDGSFVTAKEIPNDFDACWDPANVDPDLLDPVFLNFDNRRAAQKVRFGGELFPSSFPANTAGQFYLDFLQVDKDTGDPKGIVALDLGRLND